MRFLSVLFLALLVGCGGEELRVETRPAAPGVAYFRPIRDGQGNEYPPNTPETALGEVPTSWPIPPALVGGWGSVRIDFGGGRSNDAQFAILQGRDTVVKIAPPAVVK
jgi:hypothetical protein